MHNGKELAAKPGTRVAGWGCAAILFPCEGKRSFFRFPIAASIKLFSFSIWTAYLLFPIAPQSSGIHGLTL